MDLSPKKRKRTASPDDTEKRASSSKLRLEDVGSDDSEGAEYFMPNDHLTRSPSARPPRRDETYYLEDGSCIVLVDNVLFNVHRSILSKDGSLFATMLSLPQGQVVVEGCSDEHPIVLMDDAADEFRHFLRALYALPHELRDITSDVNVLIDIARISNKYAFKSLETWALDATHDYVTRKPSPILSSLPAPNKYRLTTADVVVDSDSEEGDTEADAENARSTALLSRLIRTAHMCQHDRLLESMIALMKPLMVGSLQYAHLAMRLADELDIRTLRGCAYLEVMHKTPLVPLPMTPATTRPPLPLAPTQRLRLLAGYYRLTRTWETLRGAAPHFDHASACGATWHQPGCTQSFNEFWREKTRGDGVLALGMADVIGRLKQIQRDFDRWGTAAYMHHDCRMAARRSIVDAVKKVEEALPDYFSDGFMD
ncbi:hypothetical protein EV714DRAFT_251192 [Schizophyllum commune]